MADTEALNMIHADTKTILSPTDLDAFLAIPYLEGGRTYGGVDCWGLARLVTGLYGRPIPDIDTVCMGPKARHAAMAMPDKGWQRHIPGDGIPANAAAPLILTLRLDHPKLFHHVGVFVGGGRFLHAQQDVGVSLARLLDFPGRIGGFYSWGDPRD